MSKIVTLFGNDPVYRRFLALHPGLWPEVGALDDQVLLCHMRRDRRRLGLPCDRWLPTGRLAFARKRSIR